MDATAYQRFCDAHKFHKIEELIPPFPVLDCNGNMSEQEHQDSIDWAWDWGRICKFEELPDQCRIGVFNHIMAKNKVNDDNIRVELASVCDDAYEKATFPEDAPEQVARAVNKFEKEVGEIPAPWEDTRQGEAYKRLWLASLILGFGGGGFYFACNRMGEAFDLWPMTIKRFLESALKDRGCGALIEFVRRGTPRRNGGIPSIYRLRNPQMLKSVVPVRGPEKNFGHPFWEYVLRSLPWVGMKSKVMSENSILSE